MTETLRARVWPWLRLDFADDLERRDFDEVRRQRTFEGVAAVGLVQVLVLIAFWPTDLLVEAPIARKLGYFRAGIVGLWCAVWLTARWRVVRRHIDIIVVPYVIASAMATVWLGPATALDAAWVDVCIIVPMFSAVLVQPLGLRVVVTSGVSLGFVVIYFAFRPDQLDNPHMGTFGTGLMVATLGSIAVGHIYSVLVHQQFVRSRHLARKNHELELVVMARTAELVELTERRNALQDEERRAVESELSARAGAFMRSCRNELSRATTTNDTVKEALERIAGLLDTLDLQLDEALGGDCVEIDLPARIRRAVEAARPSTHMDIVFDVEVRSEDLPASTRNALFRMFQEAFTNALKHSHATRIIVTMNHQNGRLDLSVADNGMGIAAARQKTHRGTGIGLESLRQRATDIGAELRIASGDRDGTVVAISYHGLAAATGGDTLGGPLK